MPQQLLLLFGVLPLGLGAGVLDWALHRRTSIETTAGLRESALHLLMLAEIGILVLALLWLEVNAGILALCAAGFVLHDGYAGLRRSAGRPDVMPLEQMI